jgi:hypothetical protein
MRGVPPHGRDLLTFERIWREADGLVLTHGRGAGLIWRAPHAAGHRGRRARQLGTPGGLPPKGRDESCRIAYGELPGSDPCRYGGPLWRLISPTVGRARFSCSTSKLQARRALARP